MNDATLTMTDGRTVGFATYGPVDGTPVLWCHGGPGSRLEPAGFEPFLEPIGLRVIGIDRPGYGLSSLRTGRSIADSSASIGSWLSACRRGACTHWPSPRSHRPGCGLSSPCVR
jgi:pimeloyl-ACP methyl ester carboxylesterase